MERSPTTWEQEVLSALADVEFDRSDVVRDSLPHLVVTGGCECGCASFNVRDVRYPAQPHQLYHLSNGVSANPAVGFVLWLGPDGRPISVDVDNAPGILPDPKTITVSRPMEQ